MRLPRSQRKRRMLMEHHLAWEAARAQVRQAPPPEPDPDPEPTAVLLLTNDFWEAYQLEERS